MKRPCMCLCLVRKSTAAMLYWLPFLLTLFQNYIPLQKNEVIIVFAIFIPLFFISIAPDSLLAKFFTAH